MDDIKFEEIQTVLTRFDDVWERVTGKPQVSSAASGSSLRELIQMELLAAEQNRSLACAFSGSCRAALLRQGEAAARRARTLRGELFIREGDACVQPEKTALPCKRMNALRASYLHDVHASKEYRHASRMTREPELSALFKTFEAEHEEAAAEKKALIIACI